MVAVATDYVWNVYVLSHPIINSEAPFFVLFLLRFNIYRRDGLPPTRNMAHVSFIINIIRATENDYNDKRSAATQASAATLAARTMHPPTNYSRYIFGFQPL